MKSQASRLIVGACLASLLLLAVCDTASAFRLFFWRRPARQGPPAHAPAHGYRRQHICGYELVFDTGLGVYVAVGHTDIYYHQGHFYRCHAGVWQISLRADVWKPAGIDKLPPGLRIKAKSMAKLNGNGNSLVKLNGNGNSLVKLNGNASNDNKADGKPGVNASRLSDGPGGNANSSGKPDAAANQPGAGSTGNDNKAAKANTDGNSNHLSGNRDRPDTKASANQRSSRPAGGKAKSGSKGKRK